MGLLRSSLKENNEAGLPMFTESSFHVGTGKYSRLCVLFPASWAPLLFLPGWKQLLKAGGLWVTSKMKCSIFPHLILTFFKKQNAIWKLKKIDIQFGGGQGGEEAF